MKKLLLVLLFLIAPLMGSATLALPNQPVINQTPAQKLASPTSQATPQPDTEEEDDEDDNEDETDTTEAPPALVPQTPASTNVPTTPVAPSDKTTPPVTPSDKTTTPATTPSNKSTTTPVVPSDKTAAPATTPTDKTTPATTPTKQEQPEDDEKEVTRPITVFNKTGRTVTLYGISTGDTNPKLLVTLQVGSAPAQTITIPEGIDSVFIEDTTKSNTISLDADTQLVTIEIASSVGTFTYNITAFSPEYGKYLTVYNGTGTDQTIIIEMSANVPGLVFSTITTPRYAYTISAQTMLLITLPQLALPALQNKQAKCGLPNTIEPLSFNVDKRNVFIITQDNGTTGLHKV